MDVAPIAASPSKVPDSGLWAITTYFNPVGYQHRRTNYGIFRSRLKVPLVTVELGFGGNFELGDGDAEILIQLSDGDVMWQKERLLNVALTALPAACSKVAWLDCDIIFEEEDWAERVCAELDRFAVVQPFDRVYHLARDRVPDESSKLNGAFVQTSMAGAMNSGMSPSAVLSRVVDRTQGTFASFAWAARRELLDSGTFYDGCIVGGGDTAFVFAACGLAREVSELHSMNRRQRDRYLTWAQRLHALAGGSISHVPGHIFHLWHGEIADRRARERHQQLSRLSFDPYADISIAGSGAWQWASSKPALHNFLNAYFAGRREDG